MAVLGLRMPGQGYQARDVINAPALKARIKFRSLQRNDPPEIRAWLMNHFYRYAVANFNADPSAVRPIGDAEEARRLLQCPEPLPLWLQRRFAAAVRDRPAWWIDPDGAQLRSIESELLEFLGSRKGTPLEGKLQRINAMQALAMSKAEHAAFQSSASLGWRQSNPDAVHVVWQGKGGTFVELIAGHPELRAEMAFESQSMRHCLGQFADRRALRGGYGEIYASACEAGRLRLYSYRTSAAQPRITLSAEVNGQGELEIDQIKGKQNRPPVERYRDEVLGFLNSLPTTKRTPPDAISMGLVRLGRGWRSVSTATDGGDQMEIVHLDPALIRSLPNPIPAAQWLVAARDRDKLHGMTLIPDVARALQWR